MPANSRPSSAPKSAPQDSLGRLKSFGLSELWQVALLLPSDWDDLTCLVEQFVPGQTSINCVVAGKLAGLPQTRFGNGAPLLTGYLVDQTGRKLGFSRFGDSREFVLDLKDNPERVILCGQMETFNNICWLKNPEVVQEKWVGRFRPRYPGKTGVIKPDTVRDRIMRSLRQAVPEAAEFLARELQSFGNRQKLSELAGVPGWSLENILAQAHVPRSIEYGRKAQKALDYLAALGIIKAAQGNRRGGVLSRPLRLGDWRKRAASIPFPLTDEQEQAVAEVIMDLSSSTPMRRLLLGDVGTGKTAVIGTVVASVVDGLGTAVVLLPNESLAAQIAREFKEWWPDLPIQLLTGDTKEEACAPLIVGTTAVLFRNIGNPDCIVIDEQQRFARHQREHLVGTETHLLESTATLIPRSMALFRYGVMSVSKLTKCHTPKIIHTTIWEAKNTRELAGNIKSTIKSGDQVLYVYPLREKSDKSEEEEDYSPATGKPELTSATEVYEKWQKIFPGKVRLLHGQMSVADKAAALEDMRENRASVLVATTVVEVGINIPRLRRVVVVHPDRFGLSTLHQIRGRAARNGGVGWCDLVLPNPVKEATMERLRVLVDTEDGFEVAARDMKIRGVGDMSKDSSRQSGADNTFLYGRPVSIDAMDAVMEMLV